MLILIVYFIASLILAIEAADIAEQKGASGTKYFLYTIFMMPFALLLLIALPDKGNSTKSDYSSDELPKL